MGHPQRHEVPNDQRHLPRLQRQHPYRWLNDAEHIEVRREAGEAIAGVDKAIHKALNDLGGGKFTRTDHEDAEQDIRLEPVVHFE